MKNLRKHLLIIIAVAILILIATPLKSHAALQSNPTTHYNNSYKKAPTTWMNEIRQMEAENGTMGLSEQFNSDLTTKEGTSSNNIDVHMMRSTEYGAIAILSTSGYGNPNTMQASTPEKSTTGNKTGVYYTTNNSIDSNHREWVAGGLAGSIFGGANARYYDAYSTTNGAVKIGDAMNLRWQGAFASWVSLGHPYFVRNYYGYFGFDNNSASNTYFGRGVAVCGVGL